jgi:hypothetical protein
MSDWSMLDCALDGQYHTSGAGPRARRAILEKEKEEEHDIGENEIINSADQQEVDKSAQEMEEDEHEIAENDNETSVVQIRSSNHQRKAWTPQMTKDVVTKMEKKKIAIYGWQETGIFKEKETFSADSRCHCFFQSFSKTELQARAKLNQLAKLDKKMVELQTNKPAGWEVEADDMKQTRAHVAKTAGSNHVAKQGIAIFILKTFFPVCTEISRSTNHITVLATPTQSHKKLLVTVVYGPPDSAANNNTFWSETIRPSLQHATTTDTSHVILGDMNAVMEQRKDKNNRTAKYAKLAMAETITSFGYRDEWRMQHKDTIDFT